MTAVQIRALTRICHCVRVYVHSNTFVPVFTPKLIELLGRLVLIRPGVVTNTASSLRYLLVHGMSPLCLDARGSNWTTFTRNQPIQRTLSSYGRICVYYQITVSFDVNACRSDDHESK